MNNRFKTYIRKCIVLLLSLPLGGVGGGLLLGVGGGLLSSCSDSLSDYFGGGEIEEGEQVQFTTMVPDVAVTSRSAYDEWKAKVDAYKPVNRDYTFNIEMWKQGDATATGSATYKPSTFEDLGIENTATKSHNGTLELAEGATPLYWEDNVNAWGFLATSVSSENIEADQSDQTKWLYQDKLVGYSYLPVWEATSTSSGQGSDGEGHGKDDFNAINYRTSKQWYQDNKTAQQLSGLMVEGQDQESFKKIPLYMQH